MKPLTDLSPQSRKAFLMIIRQFAIDTGLVKEFGLEGAEEAILHEIQEGRVKLFWDKEERVLTLEVK